MKLFKASIILTISFLFLINESHADNIEKLNEYIPFKKNKENQ